MANLEATGPYHEQIPHGEVLARWQQWTFALPIAPAALAGMSLMKKRIKNLVSVERVVDHNVKMSMNPFDEISVVETLRPGKAGKLVAPDLSIDCGIVALPELETSI